jgi:DNA polymerase III alpha subunit (gram-positive type)
MKDTLLRFNKKQKYVFFDYETCNLNLASTKNKPWQLAFIVVQNNKILDKADYVLAWDDLQVSPDAARITGFSMAKYNRKKSCPVKALNHFEKYLYDEEILKVGHNLLGFDVYIHNIHRKLVGKRADYTYINGVIDTLCLAKSIKKGIKSPKDSDRLSWQYRLLNHKEKGLKASLTQCCKDYSIPFDPSKLHDALYDIQKNQEVFQKMLWEVEV